MPIMPRAIEPALWGWVCCYDQTPRQQGRERMSKYKGQRHMTKTYDTTKLIICDIRSGYHPIRHFRNWCNDSVYKGYLVAQYDGVNVALCENSNGKWALLQDIIPVSEDEYRELKAQRLRDEVKKVLYEKVYTISLDSLSQILSILQEDENNKG
jgi:hypothetical protein